MHEQDIEVVVRITADDKVRFDNARKTVHESMEDFLLAGAKIRSGVIEQEQAEWRWKNRDR